MKSYCIGCKKVHTDMNWQTVAGIRGWKCSKWYQPARRINTVQNRSLRPDGSVATGLEGIRIRDNRLRSQEKRLTK